MKKKWLHVFNKMFPLNHTICFVMVMYGRGIICSIDNTCQSCKKFVDLTMTKQKR